MRIGEVLGLEIDKHFADNFSAVLVRQKVRKSETENYLKTDTFRDIDLNASVVKMLEEFIGLRASGFLFAFRNGKPLSESNILNRHLHPFAQDWRWNFGKSRLLQIPQHAPAKKSGSGCPDSMVAWSRWEKHDGRILASQRQSEVPQIGRGTSGNWI